MTMAVSTELTILIVLFYLVLILGLGYYGYQRTKKVEDYMVAGRNTHPMVIALSYGATFISTSAIVGFGGTAAQYGMSLMWLTVLCIVVGVMTLGIPYMTALLGFAGVVALYVVIGGLIAVMYTDAVQGAIMLAGMGILLVLTYVYLGGVTAANSALEAMTPLVPENLAAIGMTGWTSMPEFGSPVWMTVITTLVLGVGIGVLAQPQLAVRFMTAKDGKSLNRAVPMGALFIVMMTGVAFTVGPLTNVYFMETTGQLALAAGNADSVIPLYINVAMPELFVIIFMLTLLSAAMSTLSSLLHTMGTTLGGDMFARLKGKRYSVRANQVGIVVMMLASLAIAVVMPRRVLLPVRQRCLWVCVRRHFCLRLRTVLRRRRRRCSRRSGV